MLACMYTSESLSSAITSACILSEFLWAEAELLLRIYTHLCTVIQGLSFGREVCAVQVSQWLKMEMVWRYASDILPGGFQQWAQDGRLCRLYLTISVGLLEPFCAIAGLLLCRGLLT